MRLTTLIAETDLAPDTVSECEITGLSLDSRTVKQGNLFAALSGSASDGAAFISDAVAKGARAVLTGSDAKVSDTITVPVLRAQNPRQMLAQLAAKFYAPQPSVGLAVTGTSGKTSVADFTRQLLLSAGKSAASMGTIGVITATSADYGSLTTPDTVTLHKTLQGLAQKGVDHVVMEASSHGLDQYRLDGFALNAAAFTNLGRDHLDYHADMDAYFAAKMRLFADLLPPSGSAVVNVDDPASDRVIDIVRQRGQTLIDVGRGGTRVHLRSVTRDGFAQTMALTLDGHDFDVRLGLVGDYQVSNALVAAGLALAVDVSPSVIAEGLGRLKGVAGRLEIIGEVNGALLVVDYAHKPEALAAALRGCRPFASGKLIVVFGCGGDRDRGKRPLMGRIAKDHGDVVIVTDDNPRTEEASDIRAEVMAGLSGLREIGDRRSAIREAVGMAEAGDVVLVAGKGHETGQIIGQEVKPFSDHEELKAAMEIFAA